MSKVKIKSHRSVKAGFATQRSRFRWLMMVVGISTLLPATSLNAFDLEIMLQDAPTIRYYQKLTDALVDFWHRGYRFDDLRLYLDGYIAGLRDTNALEPYFIHRLEEEAGRFLRDPSNFELSVPTPEFDYR